MSFPQRLIRFMIGVLIGLGLVVLFFNEKLPLLTDWTPKNRVKARVLESYHTPDEKAKCLLECAKLDWNEIKELVPESDVDFSLSQTKGELKEYQLTSTYNEKPLKMRFAVRDSSVWLSELKGPFPCECN